MSLIAKFTKAAVVFAVSSLSFGSVLGDSIDVNTSAGDSSVGSLGAALSNASQRLTPDTLNFSAAFDAPQSVTLTASYATVTKSRSLNPSLNLSPLATVTINDGGFSVFNFQGAGTSYLDNFSLTGSGVGLSLAGNTTVAASNLTVADSVVLGDGGATIYGARENGGMIYAGSGYDTTITLSGKITGTGSLTVGTPSGDGGGGIVALTGAANDYSGGTTVQFGINLYVQNGLSGSATGSGPLTVNRGGNVAGVGSIHASSFSFVSGLVVAGSDSEATGTLVLTGKTASTFSNSQLYFHLGSGASQGESNLLDLGDTPVTFDNSEILFSVVGEEEIQPNTRYTLITMDDVIDPTALGLTVNDDGVITGGLTLAEAGLDGALAAGPYADSYLLVDGDSIDLEIVPEPSIWILLAGGVSLLVFVHRSKRDTLRRI
jgi:hypothetical protein